MASSAGARERRATTFTAGTLQFLRELAARNERPWFEANKQRYLDDVVEPALGFITAMEGRLRKISPQFPALPKRMGGSLLRIYRDTRFAADKRPYKTNVGIQFRHARGRDIHAPGFYVHIEPGACFIGAGIWHPDPATLGAIRAEILDRPAHWARIRTAGFRRHFELGGDGLQRVPRGVPTDAPHADDLRRKDFIAIAPLADQDVIRPRFPQLVASRFAHAAPLMAFLCDALDLDF